MLVTSAWEATLLHVVSIGIIQIIFMGENSRAAILLKRLHSPKRLSRFGTVSYMYILKLINNSSS